VNVDSMCGVFSFINRNFAWVLLEFVDEPYMGPLGKLLLIRRLRLHMHQKNDINLRALIYSRHTKNLHYLINPVIKSLK